MKKTYKNKSIIFPIIILSIFALFSTKTTNALDENNFGTILAIPKVETLDSSKVSTSSAMFNGSVNPNGLPTIYWFEYREVSYVSYNTGFIYAGKDGQNGKVNISVSNLRPNSVYSFNIVSENKLGRVRGEVVTFKTQN